MRTAKSRTAAGGAIIALLAMIVSTTGIAAAPFASHDVSHLGFGDLRGLESRSTAGRVMLGLGDLRVADAAQGSTAKHVGFGDLRLLDAASGGSVAKTGFGDLRVLASGK